MKLIMIGIAFKSSLKLISTWPTSALKNIVNKRIRCKKFNPPCSVLEITRKNYSTGSSNMSYNIEFDYEYLCDKSNTSLIKENICKRKSDGNIDKVISLWETLKSNNNSKEDQKSLERELQNETFKIPNKASPHLCNYGDMPHLLETYNEKPKFNFQPKEFHALVQHLNLLINDRHLHLMTGQRSYIFREALADLERALIRYTVSVLLKKGFTLISVPDLLYSHIFERCGMQTRGEVSQVFHLSSFEGEDVCLSGTAEMALGGYLQHRQLDFSELPLKLAAVSRCYRKEIGESSSEKGIYRVHQFNKVEMFGVTANETGNESKELYQELVDIQIELYSQLGFHFQVLDMPLNELGNSAYAKTDIEAWMPVKCLFGEISSASNCLDYQSRRLNLRYKNASGEIKFAHTLNGTACATPRVLITMVASNQKKDRSVMVPEVLQPFMNGLKHVQRPKNPLLVQHFNARVYSGTIVKSSEVEGD